MGPGQFQAAVRFATFLILPLLVAALGHAQSSGRVSLDVPRLGRPPSFDDFLDMQPDGDAERRMVRVEEFIQQEPSDGQTPSQRTEAYLGYDADHLYIVFVAFDTDPSQIRARLTRREDILSDDYVTVQIDTFNDRRRAITFLANPLGIQLDGMLTESAGLEFDTSFDTVWHSRGQVTGRGYVVWMAVPFRSLRFPESTEPRWGLILARENIRAVETAFWPRVSSRIESRLIQAAEMGARLTGKTGAYAIGAMAIDDTASGGDRETIAAVRVSRDVLSQSSIGAIYTSRAGPGGTNRVGGIDGRFRLASSWSLRLQSAASRTAPDAGPDLAGSAHEVELRRSGRQFNANALYSDRTEAFHTELGFDPRRDIRRAFTHVRYRFRPENRWIVSYGPSLDLSEVWDRKGQRLDRILNPWIAAFFRRSSNVFVRYFDERERLRPGDAPNIGPPIDFSRTQWMLDGQPRVVPPITISGMWSAGRAINLQPAADVPPGQGPSRELQIAVTLQPTTPLRIDTVLLSSSLRTPGTPHAIFTNRIVRSKLNWQITRELAVRSIVQYEVTTADARFTTLAQARRLNADLLVSYVLNPWTALYGGYNGNGRTLDTDHRLRRDAQQLFFKASYLHRF